MSDQTINQWRFKLRAWVIGKRRTVWTFDITFHCCTSLLVRTLYDVSLNVWDNIMMTFQLTSRNWRRLWHVYACRFSQGITKIPFKRDWWFWCHFVRNLSRYRWANNCCNIRRFGKVIAKIKHCSFFASHCIFVRSSSSITPSDKVQLSLIESPVYGLSNEPKTNSVRCSQAPKRGSKTQSDRFAFKSGFIV